MPRGKYIRTPAIKEKYSKEKIGKQNPAYQHGEYSKQYLEKKKKSIEKRIQAMLEAKQKIINETYQNKEWLFQKYCIEKNPIQAIADQCKVEFETIWNSLRQLGIPRISMVGRKYWYVWIEKEKHRKAKQDKDFRELTENVQDKIKGAIAITDIDQHKTLVSQRF
jgi:transposase